MDYLESLGLKQAVLATRAQCIDPENNKETEKANISRINILRNHLESCVGGGTPAVKKFADS